MKKKKDRLERKMFWLEYGRQITFLVILEVITIILIGLTIMLGGCYYQLGYDTWDDFNYALYGPDNIDLSNIHNPEDIQFWIKDNIEYRQEDNDIWATPKETIERGHGDCEDLALLMGWILWKIDYSNKAFIVITASPIENIIYSYHVVVLCDNEYWEPSMPKFTWGNDINIQDILTLDDALKYCGSSGPTYRKQGKYK